MRCPLQLQRSKTLGAFEEAEEWLRRQDGSSKQHRLRSDVLEFPPRLYPRIALRTRSPGIAIMSGCTAGRGPRLAISTSSSTTVWESSEILLPSAQTRAFGTWNRNLPKASGLGSPRNLVRSKDDSYLTGKTRPEALKFSAESKTRHKIDSRASSGSPWATWSDSSVARRPGQTPTVPLREWQPRQFRLQEES